VGWRLQALPARFQASELTCAACLLPACLPFPQGNDYTVSSKGTDTMLNCLMYKLSYFDFDKIMTMQVGCWPGLACCRPCLPLQPLHAAACPATANNSALAGPAAPPAPPHPPPHPPPRPAPAAQNQPTGYDRVRNYEIGHKGFTLEHHEEAFTSQNWIVRIYSVKDLANRW
jgi:hypothetical protein